MSIKMKRAIQLPLDSQEFSKNILEVEVEADTPEEATQLIDSLFADQMNKFRNSMEELKQFDKMQKALKILEHLKTTPAWSLIKLEMAKLQNK